jgi:steroid delta-isomerase-like uncharacterized protein
MTVNEVIKLNEAVMDSWNRHDTRKFLSYCDENIVWRDLANPEDLKGKQSAEDFFNQWHIAFPDFTLKVTNQVATEDRVAVELEFTGTNTGPLRMADQPEIPATNRKITNRGCYFAKAKNGKFVEVHTYPDLAGMMIALGLQEPAHHAMH